MKRLFSLISLLLLAFISLKAQRISGFGLLTDRDTYVSGETALAKLFLPDDENSKIVYVDLATLTGNHITGVTTEAVGHQGSVFLELPDSLSTGSYLVRVFVNETHDKTFAAKQILVANRFDKLDGYPEVPVVTGGEAARVLPAGIRIQNLFPAYPVQSDVLASIEMPDSLIGDLAGPLTICVSEVVPGLSFPEFPIRVENGNMEVNEDKGIVVQGKIVNKNSQAPVSGAMVYLTIPDSLPYFQYYKTGNDGQFFFLIKNHYGRIPVVVQCWDDKTDQPIKIILDSKYDWVSPAPVTKMLAVSDELNRFIEKTSDILMMRKLFGLQDVKQLTPLPDTVNSYPYYGEPTKIVDPDLFIDLPDFSEISRELLPGVKFRNYNNEPTLRVINSPFRQYFDQQPLVLIDGIPIRDLNLIKDMGTKDLDRIDINLTERYFGDLRFAGVVALYTRHSDRSRLPESDRLVMMELQAVQPVYSLVPEVSKSPHIPDLRQTLLWQPDQLPAKIIPLSFRTSEIKGKFRVLVAGRNKAGERIEYEQFFDVD